MDDPIGGMIKQLGKNKWSPFACTVVTTTTSAGLWFGENPLHFTFSLLLAQMIVIFAATRTTHAVLQRFGQPKVVSQMVAGVLLGPSGLSRIAGFKNMLFPLWSWTSLTIVGLLAFMLFLFAISVKMDLKVLGKSSEKAIAISLCCTFLPMALVMLTAYLLRGSFPGKLFTLDQMVPQLAARWALTSYVVLAGLLDELKLLTSELGRIAMSASLMADFQYCVISAAVIAVLLSVSLETKFGFFSFLSFLLFLAYVLFVARPLAMFMIRKTPDGAKMPESHFLTVLLLALFSGLLGQVVGQHVTLGPMLLGLVLPGGPPLGTMLEEKLDWLVMGLFLPVYMVVAGLRANLSLMVKGSEWGYLELLVLVSVVGKILGVLAPCLYFRTPVMDALALSLMMSCKGIFEIYANNEFLRSKIVDTELYSANLISLIVVAGISAAILKAIYDPSKRFATERRRTLEHAHRGEELRLVLCVHRETDVLPMIDMLRVSHASSEAPMCAYVAHFIPIVGHASAMLTPYEEKDDASKYTETDRIVKALRSYEQGAGGDFVVQPYVSIAPYATMHEDACALALDKKASLVIVPFHKQVQISLGIENSNNAIQTMNVNVLNYAPCSVGILISRGLSGKLQAQAPAGGGPPALNVVVYFLGGSDDREALAYAARMSENPAIGITVIYFLLPMEMRDEKDMETQLDERAVGDFKIRCMNSRRVTCRRELVQQGADVVAVIREVSNNYDLLVVGRRQGEQSQLTAGLEVWSEYPELGIIGDILASTDFGGSVSTLVVQQKARAKTELAKSSKASQRVRSGRSVHQVPVTDGSRHNPIEGSQN